MRGMTEGGSAGTRLIAVLHKVMEWFIVAWCAEALIMVVALNMSIGFWYV